MGLTLILLTGVVWGGIGIVLSYASKQRYDTWSFIGIATGISSIGAWVFLVNWPLFIKGEVDTPIRLIVILGIGGIASIVGMACLQKSMTAGAAAWAVGQSALVVPFLAGVLFLGDTLYMSGIFGVITILLSLMLFFKADCKTEDSKEPWLRYALLAFLFLGISQTMSSIPSSWESWTDTAGLRVPIVLTAGAVPLICIVIFKKIPVKHGIIKLSICYATLVVSGQILLFTAMDQLQKENRLSLAFPLALGTCIILVSMWEIYNKRQWPDPFTLSGIMTGLVGVSLLTI